MNLNFEVSLTDIGIGLELSGHSESERQEVMDFLIDVDRGMADLDWSVGLISALAISTAEDMEATDFEETTVMVNMALPTPGLPGGAVNVPMALKVVDLVQGLADQAPHLVVQIMANALFVQREAEAVKDEPVMCARPGCGHSEKVHSLSGQFKCQAGSLCGCPMFKVEWPLPLSTMCTCGHNLNWHEESHGPDKGCIANPTTGVDCECAAFLARDGES